MGATAWDAVLGSMTISQVESSGFTANATISQGYSSGSITADALYLDKSEPSVSVTSSDLATILAGIGFESGLCLSSSTITIPLAKQGCAGELGDGNHFALSATAGFAVIQSITGSSSDANATATVECCLLSSDGFTIPYSISDTADLDATSFVNSYRMAKMSVNGSAVSGLTQVTINPGLGYSKRSTDGSVYPTHTYLDRAVPTIDLTFENQAAVNAFGPLIKDNTALIVYFRKKSDGGTVVAAGTAGHIAISFGDNLSVSEGFRAQGRNPAEVTVKVHGKSLAYTVTSTIP